MALVPLLSETARFLRYLMTPETEIAAVQYGGTAAGVVKAGFWTMLAIAAGIGLARLLA